MGRTTLACIAYAPRHNIKTQNKLIAECIYLRLDCDWAVVPMFVFYESYARCTLPVGIGLFLFFYFRFWYEQFVFSFFEFTNKIKSTREHIYAHTHTLTLTPTTSSNRTMQKCEREGKWARKKQKRCTLFPSIWITRDYWFLFGGTMMIRCVFLFLFIFFPLIRIGCCCCLCVVAAVVRNWGSNRLLRYFIIIIFTILLLLFLFPALMMFVPKTRLLLADGKKDWESAFLVVSYVALLPATCCWSRIYKGIYTKQ